MAKNTDVVVSPKFSLNKEDLKSLWRGLLITLAGAALVYISEVLPKLDFGNYGPILVPFAALLVNIGRKYIAGK